VRDLRLGRRASAVFVVMLVAACFAGGAYARTSDGSPQAARIDSISPAVTRHGETVTISGHGFGGPDVTVTVGGVAARVLGASGTSVRFVVPDGAPVGPTVVMASNPGGRIGTIRVQVLFDGTVHPVLASAEGVTAVIGADGGIVTAGAATLAVPPGALHEDTAITLTPVTLLAGSPLGQVQGGVQFAPDGLHFLTPATLTIQLPAGADPTTVVGYGYDGQGESFHLVPRFVSGSAGSGPTVTMLVSHFSGAGTVNASLTQIEQVLNYQPTPAEEQTQQAIAAAVARGLTGADLERAYDNALSFWYSKLRTGFLVTGDSLSFLELALAEWKAWQALSIELLRDKTEIYLAEDKDAHALALQATAHVADVLLGHCTGTGADVFAPLRAVNQLSGDLQLGFDLPLETVEIAAHRHLPAADALTEACMHITIADMRVPAAFALLHKDLNTVAADLRVDVWNGPARTDIPLSVHLEDRSDLPATDFTGSAATVTDGHYQTTIDIKARPHPPQVDQLVFVDLVVRFEAAVDNNDKVLKAFVVSAEKRQPVRSRINLLGLGPGDSAFTDSVSPVQAGGQAGLRVLVAGDGMAGATVSYSLNGPGSLTASTGVTDADGKAEFTYTAPANVPAGATASIDATVSNSPTESSTDTITITLIPAGTTITVDPATATLAPHGTLSFSALANGHPNTAVTWTTTGPNTINANGLFTAGPTLGTFTVTARSSQDPNASGTATVTIVPALVTNVTRESIGSRTTTGLGKSTDSLQDSDVEAPSGNDPLLVTFTGHAGSNQIVSIEVHFDVVADGLTYTIEDSVSGFVPEPACGRITLSGGGHILYFANTCGDSLGATVGTLPPGSYVFVVQLIADATVGGWEATAGLAVGH